MSCLRSFLLLSLIILVAGKAEPAAQVVATCVNPKGYAHWHYAGLVPKKESGFREDGLSNYMTTVQRLDNGEYDILYVDARGQVLSFSRDGAKIMLLRRGAKDATFLVVYPRMVIALYSFYEDKEGKKRFDLLESKGGDLMPVHMSRVVSGACNMLDLSLLR